MIIGISGKINSGKDLIGTIIQYLVDMNSVPDENMSFDSWLRCHDDARKERCTGWKIKKFADKLKDIVCLLIGCTREQLEDREFKETPLGEQWRVWYLCQNGIKVPENFYGIYSFEKEVIDFIAINKMHHVVPDSKVLTPRLMLQLFGTQCGRNIIHPDIWVNALFADYKGELKEVAGSGMFSRAAMFTEYPNWIITDTRFENEAQAIKDRNGILIRVNRHNHPHDPQPSDHPSETGLDWYPHFNHVISNDGNIEELVEKVRAILIMEKIIS